jgi:hypothetical protein
MKRLENSKNYRAIKWRVEWLGGKIVSYKEDFNSQGREKVRKIEILLPKKVNYWMVGILFFGGTIPSESRMMLWTRRNCIFPPRKIYRNKIKINYF